MLNQAPCFLFLSNPSIVQQWPWDPTTYSEPRKTHALSWFLFLRLPYTNLTPEIYATSGAAGFFLYSCSCCCEVRDYYVYTHTQWASSTLSLDKQHNKKTAAKIWAFLWAVVCLQNSAQHNHPGFQHFSYNSPCFKRSSSPAWVQPWPWPWPWLCLLPLA